MIHDAMVRSTASGLAIVHRRYGVRIEDGRYVPSHTGVCPIGALVLGTETSHRAGWQSSIWDDAARLLGVSKAWIDEFMCGWDDTDEPSGINVDAYDLAVEIREALSG